MSIRARDIMQTQVVTISSAASLLDAHRLFAEEEIGGAPVVDDDGRVVGVVSATDLVRAVEEERDTAVAQPNYYRDLEEFSGPDWGSRMEDFQDRLAERTVGEVMSTGAIVVAPDATAAEIARTLRQHRVHRVLVAEGDRLVGIVTAFDLVALLEKEPPPG
jgi:CBS domain-containing protein